MPVKMGKISEEYTILPGDLRSVVLVKKGGQEKTIP